jgi:dihydroorotase
LVCRRRIAKPSRRYEREPLARRKGFFLLCIFGAEHCSPSRSVITEASMTTRITIRRPDDWHLHVRDGEMLKAVLPYTARHFGRAILMPNLVPPIRTVADAVAYRERVMAALPQGSRFVPLMTCYLTDETDPDDVERGFRDGVFTGVKLYPANATTNSAAGVTDYRNITRVLARMEKIGMPFLMHGEEVGPDIDIFDREAAFIDRRLSKWVKEFPGLRMIMEHLSSKQGAEFVKSAAPQVGGTITPYHLNLTRTDWLGAGIKPMMYAMPVIKTANDRAALRKAATSGDACYFLGTDSAPHPFARKVAISGVPGIFNAPVALATYAKVFEEEGALDKLEAFASLNGPKHYRLPPNEDTIVLEKSPWAAPVEVKVAGADERTLVYRGGETVEWQVVAS